MFDKVESFLKDGKNLALVTDAGTPGISDPGFRLISHLETRFPSGGERPFSVIPIPGPSSLSAIISVSDIDLSEFLFLGFPPHKKGRQTLFKRVAASKTPVILFESPHRVQKTFKELLGATGDRYINVGRELTKIYEEVWRGKLSNAPEHFSGERARGEFVMVIDNK
jgi:16S rRNA (cytidine1402-2'-O)-methyltransferase